MAQWMLIALGGSPKSATTAVSEHPFTTRSIGGVSTTKTALQAISNFPGCGLGEGDARQE